MRREMGFRRSIIAPILGVATAALMSIGAAQPASANEVSPMAHPSGCHFEVQAPWGAVARCSKANGGHYRALVICKDRETGKLYNYAGGWRDTGFSYAYCNSNYVPQSAGVETRYN